MAHGMSDSPPSRFLQITFRKRCRIRWQSWFKLNGWELPWIKHREVERIVKRKHTWLKCFVAYSAFHSSTTSGCHSILMPREKLGDGLQFHEASTVFRVWQSYQTTWWDWDWPKFDSLPSQLLPKMCNSMVSLQKIVWKLWNSPLKSWKFVSNCCLPSWQVIEANPQKYAWHPGSSISYIYVYLCASCDSNTTRGNGSKYLPDWYPFVCGSIRRHGLTIFNLFTGSQYVCCKNASAVLIFGKEKAKRQASKIFLASAHKFLQKLSQSARGTSSWPSVILHRAEIWNLT